MNEPNEHRKDQTQCLLCATSPCQPITCEKQRIKESFSVRKPKEQFRSKLTFGFRWTSWNLSTTDLVFVLSERAKEYAFRENSEIEQTKELKGWVVFPPGEVKPCGWINERDDLCPASSSKSWEPGCVLVPLGDGAWIISEGGSSTKGADMWTWYKEDENLGFCDVCEAEVPFSHLSDLNAAPVAVGLVICRACKAEARK